MKDCLTAQVQAQMNNLQCVDAQELGAAIDMIKDLEEAIYYRTIVDAMEHKNNEPAHNMYYTESVKTYDSYPNSTMHRGDNHDDYLQHTQLHMMPHDEREGRSATQRKTYIESKELHHPKELQIKELEKYMQELSNDIVDMIKDATPEEKQLLQKKLAVLATKVNA